MTMINGKILLLRWNEFYVGENIKGIYIKAQL